MILSDLIRAKIVTARKSWAGSWAAIAVALASLVATPARALECSPVLPALMFCPGESGWKAVGRGSSRPGAVFEHRESGLLGQIELRPENAGMKADAAIQRDLALMQADPRQERKPHETDRESTTLAGQDATLVVWDLTIQGKAAAMAVTYVMDPDAPMTLTTLKRGATWDEAQLALHQSLAKTLVRGLPETKAD